MKKNQKTQQLVSRAHDLTLCIGLSLSPIEFAPKFPDFVACTSSELLLLGTPHISWMTPSHRGWAWREACGPGSMGLARNATLTMASIPVVMGVQPGTQRIALRATTLRLPPTNATRAALVEENERESDEKERALCCKRHHAFNKISTRLQQGWNKATESVLNSR